MKCENCVHYDMCAELHSYYKNSDSEKVKIIMKQAVTEGLSCPHYKHKSSFIINEGDVIYAILELNNSIQEFKIVRINGCSITAKNDKFLIIKNFFDEFNKTLFLTKEQAEKVFHNMR